MGINDLQLSAELVGILYPESLIVCDDEDMKERTHKKARPAQSVNEPIPFLGKNAKSICFLVSYPGDLFMPDEALRFLERILAACKCSLDDIALINTHQVPVDLEALRKQFNPRILFLWGDQPVISGLEVELKDLTVSIWGNISILPVTLVEQMNKDNEEGRELKRNLWVVLKTLFNL